MWRGFCGRRGDRCDEVLGVGGDAAPMGFGRIVGFDAVVVGLRKGSAQPTLAVSAVKSKTDEGRSSEAIQPVGGTLPQLSSAGNIV